MNRKWVWLVVGLCCYFSSNLANATQLPERIEVAGTQLILNGSGARTKYLMEMYAGGLYLTEPSSKASAIQAADAPMAIRIVISSSLVSQEKLVASINEGFQNSTGGRTTGIEPQINAFRRCFAEQISKGDVFEIAYLPGRGVIVLKNSQQKGIIPGLAFKQAVFGIWLSDNPADADLRVAMLQGRN